MDWVTCYERILLKAFDVGGKISICIFQNQQKLKDVLITSLCDEGWTVNIKCVSSDIHWLSQPIRWRFTVSGKILDVPVLLENLYQSGVICLVSMKAFFERKILLSLSSMHTYAILTQVAGIHHDNHVLLTFISKKNNFMKTNSFLWTWFTSDTEKVAIGLVWI